MGIIPPATQRVDQTPVYVLQMHIREVDISLLLSALLFRVPCYITHLNMGNLMWGMMGITIYGRGGRGVGQGSTWGGRGTLAR